MKLEAGRWLMLLIVYFTLFIFLTAIADSTQMNDYLNLTSYNTTLIGSCVSPRYAIAPDGTETEINDKAFMKNCNRHTRGTFDNVTCSLIEGCEYREEVNVWYWFDTSEGCYGQIDITELNNNNTILFPQFTSICGLENVVSDPELCHAVGCTWDEEIDSNEINIPKNPLSLLRTTGDLFSFKYDFGFTGNANYIITFILFYLPFVMLLLVIYLLLPILH